MLRIDRPVHSLREISSRSYSAKERAERRRGERAIPAPRPTKSPTLEPARPSNSRTISSISGPYNKRFEYYGGYPWLVCKAAVDDTNALRSSKGDDIRQLAQTLWPDSRRRVGPAIKFVERSVSLIVGCVGEYALPHAEGPKASVCKPSQETDP